MDDLRCESGTLFGRIDDGVIEVKCRNRLCGHRAGVVVIHRFDVSGKLLQTLRFKDPARKEQEHAFGRGISIRSA